jgi:hypothetical protein
MHFSTASQLNYSPYFLLLRPPYLLKELMLQGFINIYSVIRIELQHPLHQIQAGGGGVLGRKASLNIVDGIKRLLI